MAEDGYVPVHHPDGCIEVLTPQSQGFYSSRATDRPRIISLCQRSAELRRLFDEKAENARMRLEIDQTIDAEVVESSVLRKRYAAKSS
jgi:hypothetical protein